MPISTNLFIFSNILSAAIGAAIVFVIFIKSDMAQIRGIRRFFRKKEEEENEQPTQE